MYCGHAHLCVCVCVSVYLSAAACLHYRTDPDVTWGSGRRCPLVVHYWANLQLVHGLHCYRNTRYTLVIHQAHRTPHALRTYARTHQRQNRRACCVRDVICDEAVPFRPYCGGVITRTRNVSEYMLVLALPIVIIICRTTTNTMV